MIDLFVLLVGIYALIGVAFALIAIAGPLKWLDPVVKSSPFRFRLIAFPGLAALWPLMGVKLTRCLKPGAQT